MAATSLAPMTDAAVPPETLPPRVALRRGRVARAVAWAGLGGFGAIFALVRARRSEAFDAAVTLKLQRREHPALETLMRAASWPGFPPQSRVIPPLIIGWLWLGRLRTEAAFQALGWGASLLSTVTKAFMRRPRPSADSVEGLRVATARLGGSSFPSGHVITYVGMYGFLAYLAYTLLRPRAARRIVVGGLLGLLALVGPSRVHQGHHWATDVTASYLLGSSYLIGLISLYRRRKAKQAGVPG